MDLSCKPSENAELEAVMWDGRGSAVNPGGLDVGIRGKSTRICCEGAVWLERDNKSISLMDSTTLIFTKLGGRSREYAIIVIDDSIDKRRYICTGDKALSRIEGTELYGHSSDPVLVEESLERGGLIQLSQRRGQHSQRVTSVVAVRNCCLSDRSFRKILCKPVDPVVLNITRER